MAKNFQMLFREAGGGGTPTLLQDQCSTGKNVLLCYFTLLYQQDKKETTPKVDQGMQK